MSRNIRIHNILCSIQIMIYSTFINFLTFAILQFKYFPDFFTVKNRSRGELIENIGREGGAGRKRGCGRRVGKRHGGKGKNIN